MCTGRQQADRDAAAHARRRRLVPADRLGDLLDVAHEVGVERLAARRAHELARDQQVAPPELERVDARAPRDLVHLRFADPLQVARPERPVGAGGGGAGVHAVPVHAHGLPAVGPRRGVAGGGAHARSVVRVRARVEVEADLAREQRAVRLRAGAHPGAHAVAARREHRLRDAVLDAHRPPGVAGERRRDRLHLRVRLGAEPAAQVGHDHAHRVERRRRTGRRSRRGRGTGAGRTPTA